MKVSENDNQNQVQPKEEKHKDIKLIVFLLFILYGIQGMIIGIVYETVPMVIKSKLSYTQIGWYMLSTYPFSLKIFWSPFVDTYYSKLLGKRRTWIIFSQFSCAIILIYLGSNISTFAGDPSHHIIGLTLSCLLLNFSICSQDIAVDGWALTLLGEKNATTASSVQSFGQIVGIFFTTVLFFCLNSVEFCNKYLVSAPRDTPILEIDNLCYFTMIIFLLVNLMLIFLFSEDFHLPKEELEEEEEVSFRETMRRVMQIFKLKGIKWFIFLNLIKNLGFVYFASISSLVFIDKGIPKTTLSMISTLIIPFQLIFLVRFGSYKDHLMKRSLDAHFVLILICAVDLIITVLFDSLDYNIALGLIFVKSIVSSYYSLQIMICYTGFLNKVVDRSLGATYLTLFVSIHNISQKWPSLFLFPLVDYVGYNVIGVSSVVVGLLIYFFIRKDLIEYEKKDVSEWKIKKD